LVKDMSRTEINQVTVTLTGSDATSGVNYINYSTDGGATWNKVNGTVVDGTGPTSMATTFVLTGVGNHDLGHLVLDVAGNQYVLADQTITIEALGAGGGGGTTTGTAEVVGTVASFLIGPDGTLLEDIEITSPDGMLTLRIPAGTLMLNADGTPATDIQIVPAEGVTAPEGYQLIGSAYEFLPPGLTFSNGTLIMNYDPAAVPEGSTLVIAYFDEATGTWVELATAESPVGTLTAQISGGHTFAIFAK